MIEFNVCLQLPCSNLGFDDLFPNLEGTEHYKHGGTNILAGA